MRKVIFITLLATIISQSSFCTEKREEVEVNGRNTVEQLFNDFSKEKDVIHLKISGIPMFLAGLFKSTGGVKGVKGVELFSFGGCDKKIKKDFNEAIKKLKDNSYDTVITRSEKGKKTKILLKIKDIYVNEIVVMTGGNDPALIRIKGKIKVEDVNDVVEKNK
jgi:hypothetical protein